MRKVGARVVVSTLAGLLVLALSWGVYPLAGESPARGATPRQSIPVHLEIASIGVSSTIIQLGLQRDGQVAVPTNTRQVGWFRLGPTPGQLGASVLLGHVDSYRGPAVFFRLNLVKVGAIIKVTLGSKAVLKFRVVKVATYLRRAFPSKLVYSAHGVRELNLVTCGGAFNRAVRSYVANVVVFSVYVGTV